MQWDLLSLILLYMISGHPIAPRNVFNIDEVGINKKLMFMSAFLYLKAVIITQPFGWQ